MSSLDVKSHISDERIDAEREKKSNEKAGVKASAPAESYASEADLYARADVAHRAGLARINDSAHGQDRRRHAGGDEP